MASDYLERGVLAGVVGGVWYGLYIAFVANPLVGFMEGLDHDGHGHDHAAHAHDEAAHAVSETTTAVVSVGSGVLWGILLGGVFAIAFYLLEPELPGPRAIKSLVLAGAGYFTVSVAPWLVLPPAAPGAEQGLDTGTRIAIYAGMMLVGALVAAAAVLAYKRTAHRGRPLGIAVGALPIVALVAVVPLGTPTVTTHGELPGTLVAAFRALTIMSQAGLWLLVAGSFSWLLGHVETPRKTVHLEDELPTEP